MTYKYMRIYKALIEKAQIRATVDGYKERHHIVPKSLGGSDDKSNLAELTAREHFVAHCLLARIHGGTQWFSVLQFKGANKAYFNSRLYETARLTISNMQKGCTPWNKGSSGGVWSEARREAQKQVVYSKLSEAHKAKLRGPKSAEHAENIRKAKLNQSVETKAKISASHFGKKMSLESIEKSRLANTGRKNSVETKAKMSFAHKCNKLNKVINSIFTPALA